MCFFCKCSEKYWYNSLYLIHRIVCTGLQRIPELLSGIWQRIKIYGRYHIHVVLVLSSFTDCTCLIGSDLWKIKNISDELINIIRVCPCAGTSCYIGNANSIKKIIVWRKLLCSLIHCILYICLDPYYQRHTHYRHDR